MQVGAKRARLMRVFEEFEILRQLIELGDVPPLTNQQVARFIVNAGELINDVADVCAQAIIPSATNINGHAHLLSATAACLSCAADG